MRILHLACVAPPTTGGIGQAAWRQVCGLRERGHDAWLFAPLTVSSPKEVLPLPVWFRFGHAAVPRDLKQMLVGADLIHLHYPWYGVAEILLWWQPATPVVVSFVMDAEATGVMNWLFRLQRSYLQPRLLSHASRLIVAQRNYAAASSLARTPQLLSGVVEIPFGVDITTYKPAISSKRTHSILFVGGLDRAHRFKGVANLLNAWSQLSPIIRTFAHLQIVGDGDDRADYEVQAKSLGIIDEVQFFGRIDQIRLIEVMAAADALVLPSINHAEAFGLVSIEAQACGTPVLVSDLPGVRDVLQPGRTGWLVPPDDVAALSRQLSHILSLSDNELTVMRQTARSWIEANFSNQQELDRLENLYYEILTAKCI